MNDSPLKYVLRRLLFARNMTAMELARQVNVPQPTIHRMLTGTSPNPRPSSLYPIADFFDISIAQLRGEIALPDEKEFEFLAGAGWSVVNAYPWSALLDWPLQTAHATGKVVLPEGHSDNLFALTLTDDAMEPVFPKQTQLIFNTALEPFDRAYVLVKLHTGDWIFRQLIDTPEQRYLKPLSPQLSKLPLQVLSLNDMIAAVLVESRLNF